MNAELNFLHRFQPGTSGRTLLLLHGTGGNEDDMLPLGPRLDPGAALLSPLGKVLEQGMPRFFRRLAEGVFDEADLIARAAELADFITAASAKYTLDPQKIVAVGYSNGANIASALLLLHSGLLAGAALWRPMVPLLPEALPALGGIPVLIAAGNQDPIVPPSNVRELIALLERAGAKVAVQLEETGHGLTNATLDRTRSWLAGL